MSAQLRGHCEFGARGEQRTDCGAGLAAAHQIDRGAKIGDRARRNVVPVFHRSSDPVRDLYELRHRGIAHQGGDQSLDVIEETLLGGGMGCAHAR